MTIDESTKLLITLVVKHPSIESVPGFANLNFGPNIVEAIEETGIHKPTVIQVCVCVRASVSGSTSRLADVSCSSNAKWQPCFVWS